MSTGAEITDRLYALLPAIYRSRDAEAGQPLQALFRILEKEYEALRQDIEDLNENWFIETCAEWLVPYIGDLFRIPALHTGGVGSFSLRAYVANVLAYRRRKGTAAVLEQVAADVSGWRARAVEFSRLLATTQHLNHVRRSLPATTSVRGVDAMSLVGSPFDTTAHSADVRHVDVARGRYGIPNVGLFLWRLQSYEIQRCAARPLGGGRYSFSPLGLDLALFNSPQTETAITHLAEEVNAPAPLRRLPLHRELESRRAALAAGNALRPAYFGTQPAFQIFLDGGDAALAPEAMAICDLGEWDAWPGLAPTSPGISVYVDPERGRLALAADVAATGVLTSHAYGFSADIGGGPYNRADTLPRALGPDNTLWWRGVSSARGSADGPLFRTLAAAVAAWNARNAEGSGIAGLITIEDSATYEVSQGGALRMDLAQGNRLSIVAASWRGDSHPDVDEADSVFVPDADLTRLLVADALRPCVRGDLLVQAAAGAQSAGDCGLHLNGLLIDGRVDVGTGDLGALDLVHCTVRPVAGGVKVLTVPATVEDNAHLVLKLDHSICGPLCVPDTVRRVSLVDSIVDAGSAGLQALGGDGQAGSPAQMERSTIHGLVWVKTLELASECLFTAPVRSTRLQSGCTRYCYLPEGSQVPHPFQCQPAQALLASALVLSPEPGLATPADLGADETDRIVARLRPAFTSLDYGDAGYMQLSRACAEELRTGAQDGSEMGAFSHLRQPQREANIRASVGEYMRFGMEAGLFFVN